jgi:CRP-like cAMP-binding protein
MATLVTLTYSSPTQDFRRGEILMTQGQPGRDLFVLESGRLVVERDGVPIATIEEFDSLIGEMAVLLGKPHSATVRADKDSKVRVVKDAIKVLQSQPELALKVATLVTERLDATSALLVKLNQEAGARPAEHSGFGRLLRTIFGGK